MIQHTTYEPNWLPYAVPYKNSKPAKCDRFERQAIVDFENVTYRFQQETGEPYECQKSDFDPSKTIHCSEFVYRTQEISILNEVSLFVTFYIKKELKIEYFLLIVAQFDLHCDENFYKLTLIGTANNVGRLIFTPIMGYLSDSFGRRTILMTGVFGSAVFGYIQSFAPNYLSFVLFEFLCAGIGSVTYSASFIMAMEWIGTKDRVLLGTIVTATYPLGQIFLGLTAREVKHFRHLLQIIYAPGFFILLYYWFAPESIRWMIVRGKKTQTLQTISRAEKINKTKISQNTVDLITIEFGKLQNRDNSKEASLWTQIVQVIKKRVLLIRLSICAFVWITSAFVSYGISLTSVTLAGDPYINFVVIAVAGVPAMLFCYILMESCGRRWTLSSSLLIGGASIIISKALPANFSILSITLFFIGKCFITVAFTGLYVYTSELWPTNMRHSMMSFCSFFGRVGSIFATFAPLLVNILSLKPVFTISLSFTVALIDFLFCFIQTEQIRGNTSVHYLLWYGDDGCDFDFKIARNIKQEATGHFTRS